MTAMSSEIIGVPIILLEVWVRMLPCREGLRSCVDGCDEIECGLNKNIGWVC